MTSEAVLAFGGYLTMLGGSPSKSAAVPPALEPDLLPAYACTSCGLRIQVRETFLANQ